MNALLGTVNAILAVLEARPARAVAACMGAEEAVYRVRLYPGYHAQREPMPPELASAVGEGAGAAGEPRLDGRDRRGAGGRRRDVLVRARRDAEAERTQRNARRALLLTGDRDLFQAVNEQVAVVLPGKGGADPEEIGPAQVRERYGIDPALVTDFIALRGDPSDGLPGAPGIGAKTAAELLNRYGPLEEVLEGRRARTTATCACGRRSR